MKTGYVKFKWDTPHTRLKGKELKEACNDTKLKSTLGYT